MSESLQLLMGVAAGFLCGAIVWRPDMVDAKANARMLDRYQRAVYQLAHWCGHESPHVRIITAHIAALGNGDEPINSGTPHGDEVCDVQGTRDQLRRIDAKLADEHWSDCATSNGPAYPVGPCDCGAEAPKRG